MSKHFAQKRRSPPALTSRHVLHACGSYRPWPLCRHCIRGPECALPGPCLSLDRHQGVGQQRKAAPRLRALLVHTARGR